MNVHKLDLSQMAAHRATHLVILTHADFTQATANTAQVIEMLPVVAGTLARVSKVQVVDALQDVSDAAFNTTAGTIGDGSDVDRFLPSTEFNVNGTEILGKAGLAVAAPAVTAATVATADGSDAGTTQTLANALKVELNKVITDLAALRAGSPYHFYAAADTIDFRFSAMADKALVDLDSGEIHVYLDVLTPAA